MKTAKSKKILVTGGAGFIGSHLCEYLLNQDNQVICLDNFYSGSKENIVHLFANPNFEFICYDVTRPFWRRVDEIYNLACPASPISYQFDPVYTVRTNILGMLNMLELAKKTGAKILQASTSEIYGDPLQHPQKETYYGNVNTVSPRACYDEGKRAAETLCADYAREYGVDVRVVRIFNTFGPAMALNDGRAISNFIVQALRGEDITIYGDGGQTRSFQYIDDLIAGMVKMMDNPDFCGPVNLGNPGEISIKELAERIIKFTGSSSGIVYLPALQNDPQKRMPDISLAKKKLNWQPRIDFKDGLKATIDYFAERLKSKTNILVFSTAYKPFLGPAEEHLAGLISQMPDFHFHIVTSRLDRNLPKIHEDENFTIHRIGLGSAIDKYLLVLIGPLKAGKLHKKKNFSLTWSVMASYGALASLIFKFWYKVPFIVLMHRGDLEGRAAKKAKLIWPIYKWIFKKSAAIKAPDDALAEKARNLRQDFESDLLSVESTLDVRKIKETHYRIINKLNRKLHQPR